MIKHFVLSFTFFWKFSGRSKCFIEPKIIRKWKRYLLERGVVVVTRSKIRGKKKLHGVKNSSSIRTSQWSVRTIIFHRSLYLSFFSSPSFFFPDTRRLSKTHYHALWYTDGKKKIFLCSTHRGRWDYSFARDSTNETIRRIEKKYELIIKIESYLPNRIFSILKKSNTFSRSTKFPI